MTAATTGLHVTVVGIGADGWAGLPEHARALVADAEVLLGGERHLASVPSRAVRRPWPSPLAGLPEVLAECAGHRVVALASGDPMVSGIGTTLVRMLGADAVTVVPAVSSVALARARMGWSAESSAVLTLVGRDPDALRRELSPGRRLLVLSSDETTPAAVAAVLVEEGFEASRLTVLADLGSPDESRTEARIITSDTSSPQLGRLDCGLEQAQLTIRRLNILAVEVAGEGGPTTTWATGLPDDAFEHDGQITKRDLRASALARLQPRPGELLWDVGAGAGSVAIEWLRAHPLTGAVAVEADTDRSARIRRNAGRLGVPRLDVVDGRAPEALAGLSAPDAVFVGGGATAPGLLDTCRDALRPGGRLVAHGVTIETEQLLLEAWREHGGELVRIGVEQAAPLGRFSGWSPARAVTQWSWTKGPDA